MRTARSRSIEADGVPRLTADRRHSHPCNRFVYIDIYHVQQADGDMSNGSEIVGMRPGYVEAGGGGV